MFKKIRANFITGMVIVVPIVLTFWVLYFIIDKLNALFLQPVVKILENWAPAEGLESFTKVLIFIFLLSLVTVIGFATRILILRNFFAFGESVLYRVPMINTVYRTIKEISGAFWMHKASIFQRVVLIEYPRKGLYSLAFVTSETEGEVQEKTHHRVLSLFVPTSPNPTSGMMIMIPENDAINLGMTVTEGMKMVISGGAIVPKKDHGDTKEPGYTSEKKGF